MTLAQPSFKFAPQRRFVGLQLGYPGAGRGAQSPMRLCRLLGGHSVVFAAEPQRLQAGQKQSKHKTKRAYSGNNVNGGAEA